MDLCKSHVVGICTVVYTEVLKTHNFLKNIIYLLYVQLAIKLS